jgi:excisionase family DNA binding protein
MGQANGKAANAGDRYTTGQVARMLRVAARTVSRWLDRGAMRGYRLPGPDGDCGHGRDRRVLRNDLIAFCRAKRIPLPRELAGEPWALLVGGLDALGPVLCLLPEDGWRLTATLVGAAALLHEAPALLVVDAAYPFEEMATLARLAGCRALALGYEDVTEVRLAEAGFEVYRRPFSPAAVAGLVAGVIGESL